MATGRPVMFLRTAETEQRIADLEEKMALVLERLGMTPKETNEEWEAAAPKSEPQTVDLDIPLSAAERVKKAAKGKARA